MLLSRQERFELIATLATNRWTGDLVPGLAGIRKIRFAAPGKGKRGSFRVIYYIASIEIAVLALLIYGKNEQANRTPDQRRAMAAVVRDLKVTR